MKILVSISQYGIDQENYLKEIISEFKHYKNHTVDITVHGTIPLNIPEIEFIRHDPCIRKNLVFKHRKEFIEKLNDYDLFIYTENDMLIKEDAIDTYLKYDSSLPMDYCLGFIRFEHRAQDMNLYLPDMNEYWGLAVSEKKLTINGNDYFGLFNIHQGCWMLTREKLKHICNTPHFIYENDSLEHGASSIFNEMGWNFKLGGSIKKIYTRHKEDLSKCLIHHLSDKYCNINSPEWQCQPGPLTFNSLIDILDIRK